MAAGHVPVKELWPKDDWHIAVQWGGRIAEKNNVAVIVLNKISVNEHTTYQYIYPLGNTSMSLTC